MQVPVLARLVANCYTLLYFALLYHGSARRNSWVTSTQRHDDHAFQMAIARTPVSGCNHLTIFVQANLHPVRNHTSNKVAHHTTLLYSPLSQIKIITLVFVTLSIILSVTSHQQKLPFWTWHWIHAVKHNITFQLKLQKLQELCLFNALTFLMKGHLALFENFFKWDFTWRSKTNGAIKDMKNELTLPRGWPAALFVGDAAEVPYRRLASFSISMIRVANSRLLNFANFCRPCHTEITTDMHIRAPKGQLKIQQVCSHNTFLKNEKYVRDIIQDCCRQWNHLIACSRIFRIRWQKWNCLSVADQHWTMVLSGQPNCQISTSTHHTTHKDHYCSYHAMD